MPLPHASAPVPAGQGTDVEHKVAGSPAAQAAGHAVQALAKAARSFVLYDAQNKLVRQLLEQFRDKTKEAIGVAGELPLDFGPFSVSLRGEVVYQDQDREKSLAFKLFRDGVRRLTITPAADWGELLRLLEIIALRYTAMRQQEEDAVTLVRKAEFKGVGLVAVEGFAPAEERPEADAPADVQRGPRVEPPVDFDTPLPRLPNPGRVAYTPIPPLTLASLQAEEADALWAQSAVALGKALVEEAHRSGWDADSRADLVQYFDELRDAMLADGAFAGLTQLLTLVERLGGAAADVQQALRKGLSQPKAIDALVDSLPPEATAWPAEFLPLVPLLDGAAALDRLVKEPDARRSGLLLSLVLSSGPKSAEALVPRLGQLEPSLARTVAKGLVQKAPKLAVQVGQVLLASPDDASRVEGLDALVKADGEVPSALVLPLLDAASAEVRAKALGVIERRGDEEAAQHLMHLLEQKERPLPEVEAMARALSAIAPVLAAKTYLAWGHPKARVLGGLSAQQKRLQWAAVAGMAVLPGAEAERQLQGIAQGTQDEALRRHCFSSLARHRKGGQPRG